MEKMSIIFLAIIIIYLLYAFLKSRQKKEACESSVSTYKKKCSEKEEENEYERHAIAAVIASVMGDKAYRIKRVYLTATEDEKKSSWKISGRNESMNRRVFFKK